MKRRFIYIVFFLVLLLNIFLISASIKTSKNNYTTGEIIYAISNIRANDYLCRSQNPSQTIKLSVVENKDSWKDGDSFTEITSSEVPNSGFSSKKIWESPKPGDYDLLIDCNNDQRYNEASELLYNIGFTVVVKEGIIKISLEEKNIANFSWYYDSEEPALNLDNEILLLKLVAENEDIILNNLIIEIKSPENSTISLEVYVDKNNDGLLNPVDVSIGKIETKEKRFFVGMDYTLSLGASENLLFVYKMNQNYLQGDYSLKVVSLKGTGILSEKPVTSFVIPIESSIMTILKEKTCLGTVNLILTPSPAEKDSIITAVISDLTGCDNKNVYLKTDACYLFLNTDLGSCVLTNNTCQIKTIVLEEYYACLDKNGDSDFNDFGESDSEKLEIVKEIPKETEEKVSAEIITNETIQPPTAPITGQVIGGITKLFEKQGSLIVILEVTLILIFIILLLIFFRLKIPSPASE